MKPKAVITGGGTGGHIYPALSVAKKLIEKEWDILYIGSRQGMEKEIIKRENIDFRSISVAPFPRRFSISLLKAVFVSMGGFGQSLKLLRSYKPQIVLGTGGFVAGPVVLAGSLLGAKTIIHEQNVFPGFTNRLLSRRADKVALNFGEAVEYFPGELKTKAVVTGNPVREKIRKAKRSEGIKKLGLKKQKTTLLVLGGSQGSESINQAMDRVCRYASEEKGLQIIYITGKNKYSAVKERLGSIWERNSDLHLKPYLHNIEWAYAAADLMVSRAGATVLAEITVQGLPAILIPYPHASGDHQSYNAQLLAGEGAAVVIPDEKLSGEILLKEIKKITSKPGHLQKMAENSKKMGYPEALNNIVEEIENLK